MKKTKLAVAIQSLIFCVPAVTLAQGASDQQQRVRPSFIEEIVVTGVAGGGEMRKLDAEARGGPIEGAVAAEPSQLGRCNSRIIGGYLDHP